MTSSEAVDVLIVGAGPVGVTAANLLGQAGLRVLIVDRDAEILTIPRAIGLDDEGGRVLQSTGLLETMADDLLAVERVQLMSPSRGELLNLRVCTERNGHPILRTFHQPTLERHLRRGLDRFANVELAVRTECVSFNDIGDGVRIELMTPNGSRQIEARFLLGCDGAHSFVRRKLGIELDGMTYGDAWLVVDAGVDPGPERNVQFLCDPARPGVTLPAPDGGRRWEFMLLNGETAEEMTQRDTVRQLLSPWGDIDDMNLGRVAVYTFHARTARRMQRGNVFLLGDAAHLTPPFVGQGLMAGLRDAANIAWKIASVVNDGSGRSLVDTYEEERLPNVRRMVSLARHMGALVMPTNPLTASARDVALRSLRRIPWLESLARDVRIKPSAVIKRGFLGRCKARRSLRAGETFPQIQLRSRRGTAIPSDDLRRGRWAIVGVDAMPGEHLASRQHQQFARHGTFVCVRTQRAPRRLAVPTANSLAVAEPLPANLRPGHFYVVRPDNHVYAACSPEPLEGVVDDLLTTLRCP